MTEMGAKPSPLPANGSFQSRGDTIRPRTSGDADEPWQSSISVPNHRSPLTSKGLAAGLEKLFNLSGL